MPRCDHRSELSGNDERTRTTAPPRQARVQRAPTAAWADHSRSDRDVTERGVESPVVGVTSDDDMHEHTSAEVGGQQLSFDLDARQPLASVLLTERQVCELIGRTTLRSLSLRPEHINRCVRYLARDVERYIAALT
jgi:hypothetical protein